MNSPLRVTNLSVVLVAANHNPSILNPDFLKNNGIVDSAWEAAEGTVSSPMGSSVQFANGFLITAALQRLTFDEYLGHAPAAQSVVIDVARRYILTLRHVDYSAIGFNVRGFIPASEAEEEFVMEHLIADGPWKEFGTGLRAAKATFDYQLEDATFNVIVESGDFQYSDEDVAQNVVGFAGNFHRNVAGGGADLRIAAIQEALDRGLKDLDTFRAFVNDYICAGLLEGVK